MKNMSTPTHTSTKNLFLLRMIVHFTCHMHDLSVHGEVAGKQENFLIDTWAAISTVCAEFLQSSPLASQKR